MVEETIRLLVSRLNTMTDQEREKVLCALLNRYCVGCGKHGDWTHAACDCEPGERAKVKVPESPQLWLNYNVGRAKAA